MPTKQFGGPPTEATVARGRSVDLVVHDAEPEIAGYSMEEKRYIMRKPTRRVGPGEVVVLPAEEITWLRARFSDRRKRRAGRALKRRTDAAFVKELPIEASRVVIAPVAICRYGAGGLSQSGSCQASCPLTWTLERTAAPPGTNPERNPSSIPLQ